MPGRPSQRRPSATGSPRRSSGAAQPARRRPRPPARPPAVELRGDAHLGRAAAAEAFARFCRGLIDAVAPYVVGGQAAARVLRGARLGRHARVRGRLRLRARGRAARDRRRQARRHRLDRRGRTRRPTSSRGGGSAPLADALTVNTYLGRRLARAVPRRLPPRRGRASSVSSRRRTPAAPTSRTSRSRTAARSGSTWRSSSPSWGEDLVGELRPLERRRRRRRDLPAGGRRGRKLLPQAVPAAARDRRAGRHARPTSRAPSRAGRRARSSRSPARSSTRSASTGDDWRTAAGAEAARLKREVWAASGW